MTWKLLLLSRSTVVPYQEESQYADPHHDRGIGHVEHRPHPEVQKVRDVPKAQAVQQIPNCAAQLQAQGKGQEGTLYRRIQIVDDDGSDADDRCHQEYERLIGEEPECRSGVGDVRQTEPSIGWYGFAGQEVRPDQAFRRLVQNKDNRGNEKKRQSFEEPPRGP